MKSSREQLKDQSYSVIGQNKPHQRITLTALWGVDRREERLKAKLGRSRSPPGGMRWGQGRIMALVERELAAVN